MGVTCSASASRMRRRRSVDYTELEDEPKYYRLHRVPTSRLSTTGMSDSSLNLLRICSGDFSQEAVEAVRPAGLRQEHQGALADDYLYTVLPAEFDRSLADRSRAAPTVHPNQPNAAGSAFMHDLLGSSWRSQQESRIHWWLDVRDGMIARAAIHCGYGRVDRDDVVSSLDQVLHQTARKVSRVARNSDCCDSLCREECRDDGS